MKRRTVINFLCVLLSILFIGSAAGLGFNIIRAYEATGQNLIAYPENAKKLNITDLRIFSSTFDSDLYELAASTNSSVSAQHIEILTEKKQETVNKALEQYKKDRAKFIEEYLLKTVLQGGDADYEDYAINENAEYTVPEKTIRNVVSVNTTDTKLIKDIKKILNGTPGLGFLEYADFVPQDTLENNYFNYSEKFKIDESQYRFEINNLTFAKTSPKKYIERSFDTFLETVQENLGFYYDYYDEYDEYDMPHSFKYYVINNKTGEVSSNLSSEKDKAINYIKSAEFYYANVGGKVESKGLKEFAEDFEPTAIFADNFDSYVTVDTSGAPSNDQYLIIENLLKSIKESNFVTQFILAVISALLGVILLIIALINSSKKRNVIDKIFTDIHFAVTVALGIGVFAITVVLFDNNFQMVYGGIAPYIISVVALVMWALLSEFLCSLVRVCKSDKKLLHNCLGFLILRWIARKIKKGFSAVKLAFSYRPNKLHKTTIPLILCIFPVDIVFGIILFFCVANGMELGALLSLCVLFGSNISLAVFWIKYLISLDKIIAAAKERREFEEDLDKLPQSLKTLQESMKYTNLELKEAVAKAVKDERLRTELITNVSHDLKTPLTSIITYVDLLNQCDIKDEKAKEYIKVLDEKGLKLKRLIEDLIEASKVSSGNITLNPTKLNLSELCVQAVGEMSEEFEKRELEIKVKLPDNPPTAYADGNKTFRIIENLLSNAKKYSAKGTRIYISVFDESGYGVFEIKNISSSPLDISADELTERFVRGDKSRTNEGNGLGLSIAKELCGAMNGKLEITIDGDLFKAKVMLPLASINP